MRPTLTLTQRCADSNRDAGRTQVCLWGVLEADWLETFGLICICNGQVVIQQERQARNGRREGGGISRAVLCHQSITYDKLHANNTA